jgi:hypothetical protein
MDTLNIANAFLGSTGITAMYFGSDKVWPQAVPVLDFATYIDTTGINQSYYETAFSGETFTSFVVTNNTASWNSSTDITINTSAFGNTTSRERLMTFTSYRVTRIDNFAFGDNSLLTTVNLPALTSTGLNVFQFCTNLSAVNMPVVTSLGGSTFRNCTNLRTIDLPEVLTLGSTTFRDCTALASIDMPKLTTIGNLAFQACTALASINMPKLTTIGTNVFSSNALATGGTLNINSAITASANWNTANNLQRIQTQGWTINYINNG